MQSVKTCKSTSSSDVKKTPKGKDHHHLQLLEQTKVKFEFTRDSVHVWSTQLDILQNKFGRTLTIEAKLSLEIALVEFLLSTVNDRMT